MITTAVLKTVDENTKLKARNEEYGFGKAEFIYVFQIAKVIHLMAGC